MGQFLCDLFELWELDLEKGQQPYIRMFENWVGIFLGCNPESCEQRGVCSIQNIVEADGSVYPCDFYVLDDYCIGNLNKDTFQTIYENRRKSGYLEQSRNHDAECMACPYFAVWQRRAAAGIVKVPQTEEGRMRNISAQVIRCSLRKIMTVWLRLRQGADEAEWESNEGSKQPGSIGYFFWKFLSV